MQHTLLHEPEFDFETFTARIAEFKNDGSQKIGIDWSTSGGPTVSYYAAGDSSHATTWSAPVAPAKYSELYADFIELKLLPRLVEIAKSSGVTPAIRCVDQQAVVTQRQRRREIEAAEHATVGAH